MGMITKVRAQLGTSEKKDKREDSTPEIDQSAEAVKPLGPVGKTIGSAESSKAETATATAKTTSADDSGADKTVETDKTIEKPEPEKKLNWFQRRKERMKLEGTFDTYPHLLALKPKEKYVFRSDYFEIDNDSVACVLAYFHDDAANDGFFPFWGIDRIPAGLDDSVTTVVFEQVEKKDEKWVENHIKQSEKLEKLDANEQNETGTTASKKKAAKISGDRDTIIGEIQDGASYLSVHNRLLLKAPTLAILDDSVERLTRLYVDHFGTLKAAPYAGEQRQELSGLLKKNEKKRGKGFHFTSTEYAGSYSLVTNGLNDPDGEYVGYMVGDVNDSAVLFAANDYEHHVVVADGSLSQYLNRAQVSNMWCSKLSQACLLDNGQVVHMVLDGAELDKLGPKFDGLTSRVDMNQGDVNMFEMFGDVEDELSIFSAQMQKLRLMFEQLYDAGPEDRSIIRNELAEVATKFYIEQGMWVENAKDQRHMLRLVGIPHDTVPLLQLFSSYLDMEHKKLVNSSAKDPSTLKAYNVLKGVARDLLSTNGDLFNNPTASAIDGVRDAKRVVYEFSKLMIRGKGVAMAQLVNIVGFAIGKLGEGDIVIIHGAEYIDDEVKEYIETQFDQLFRRGGRVVFSYNDVDKMLADTKFNKFDAADYTILGSMRDRTVAEYKKQLHQSIPSALAGLVSRRGENLTYLRRGVSNVVFHLDLALGINPGREKQRREMALAANKAAGAAKYDALMSDDLVPGANLTGLGNNGGVDSDKSANGKPKIKKKKAKSLPKGLVTGGQRQNLTKTRRGRGGEAR